MDLNRKPILRFLHAEHTLSQLKLDLFRRLTTDEIRSSLAPGAPGSLKTREDGTVLDQRGHRLRWAGQRRTDDHDRVFRQNRGRQLDRGGRV